MKRVLCAMVVVCVPAAGCASAPGTAADPGLEPIAPRTTRSSTSPAPRAALASIASASLAPSLASAPPATRRTSRAPRRRAALASVSVLVGVRMLEDDLLDQAFGDNKGFGIELAARPSRSGLGWEAGLVFAKDSVSDPVSSLDVSLLEAVLGPRYTKQLGGTGLFVYGGGGLDVGTVFAKATLSGAGSDSDTGTVVGSYVHGGAYFRISEKVFVGVDARKTFGLEALDLDVDYVQLSGLIGILL